MVGADGMGECGLASGRCGGGEAARVIRCIFSYSVINESMMFVYAEEFIIRQQLGDELQMPDYWNNSLVASYSNHNDVYVCR